MVVPTRPGDKPRPMVLPFMGKFRTRSESAAPCRPTKVTKRKRIIKSAKRERINGPLLAVAVPGFVMFKGERVDRAELFAQKMKMPPRPAQRKIQTPHAPQSSAHKKAQKTASTRLPT